MKAHTLKARRSQTHSLLISLILLATHEGVRRTNYLDSVVTTTSDFETLTANQTFLTTQVQNISSIPKQTTITKSQPKKPLQSPSFSNQSTSPSPFPHPNPPACSFIYVPALPPPPDQTPFLLPTIQMTMTMTMTMTATSMHKKAQFQFRLPTNKQDAPTKLDCTPFFLVSSPRLQVSSLQLSAKKVKQHSRKEMKG
jgi:hypothetical protein